MSGRKFFFIFLFFLFFISSASALTTELNTSACEVSDAKDCSCNAINANINTTGTIGATIAKGDNARFYTWTDLSDVIIDEAEFHFRHSADSGVSGDWTINWQNDAGTETYCSDNSQAHATGDNYYVVNTTGSCSWTLAKLNDMSIRFTSGDGGGSTPVYVYYVDMFVYFTPFKPQFSNNQTNDTLVFEGDVVNHTITLANSAGYIFSWNGTNGCDGNWENSSYVTQANGVGWNTSVIGDGCEGKAIGWRFYANNSYNDWNSSSVYYYPVYSYGHLEVDWLPQSIINSTVCTEEEPCEWSQYSLKTMNATVTCRLGDCGTIEAGARYNSSGSTMDLISIIDGVNPFYIVNETEERGNHSVIDEVDNVNHTTAGSKIFGDDFNDRFWNHVNISFNITTDLKDINTIYFNVTGTGDPKDMNITTNISYCEIAGYNVTEECTSTLTRIKTDFNVSGNWTDAIYIINGIPLDTTFSMESEKFYKIVFETNGTLIPDAGHDVFTLFMGDVEAPNTTYVSVANDGWNITANKYYDVFFQNLNTSNPQSLGKLNKDQSAQVNFTLNMTGDQSYELDINFTSSYYPNVADNDTDDAVVTNITEAGVEEGYNISFLLNLLNYQTYLSDSTPTEMSYCEFNTSLPSEYDVNASIVGDSSYVQTSLVSMLNFTNIGNTSISIKVCLNESLPSNITLFGTKTNDPFLSANAITTSCWTANSSLATGKEDRAWVWVNYTNISVGEATQRVIFINSSKV